MTNSRDKGARGEREAAKAFQLATGISTIRAAQRSGKEGSADLKTADAKLHAEVKLRERIAALEFLRQAERDAVEPHVPFVLMRENGDTEWVVMCRLGKLVQLASELAAARERPLL